MQTSKRLKIVQPVPVTLKPVQRGIFSELWGTQKIKLEVTTTPEIDLDSPASGMELSDFTFGSFLCSSFQELDLTAIGWILTQIKERCLSFDYDKRPGSFWYFGQSLIFFESQGTKNWAILTTISMCLVHPIG